MGYPLRADNESLMASDTERGPADRDVESDQKFQEVFGISREELKAYGTDPDAYMAEHIHEALKDPKNQAVLLSKSTIIRRQYVKEAKTVYFWLFVTLGVLLLSAVPHSHAMKHFVIFVAFLPLAAAVWGGFRQIQTARHYREACRAEGIKSSLYRRRN
jgi:hypothetical protein